MSLPCRGRATSRQDSQVKTGCHQGACSVAINLVSSDGELGAMNLSRAGRSRESKCLLYLCGAAAWEVLELVPQRLLFVDSFH